MKALSLDTVVSVMNGRLIHKTAKPILTEDHQINIHKVVIDSRKVAKGDMYVAIVGERVDGHDYIEKAASAGACIVLAANASKVPEGIMAIIVEDVIEALGQFAAYYRSRLTIPFIGITGSVGKTSTKDMIASILSTSYKVHKTAGNYNNHIGLPLTILGIDEDVDVAVVEMGMNHFGEIDYLANILKPDIGVITNIGVSHIEFLGSKEGILKAKSELLPHVAKEGKIILNGDDDLLMTLRGQYENQLMTYGKGASCDCVLEPLSSSGIGQKARIISNKDTYDIEVAYVGQHLLFNALAGVIIAEHYNINKEDIIEGIKNFKASKMRLEEFNVDGRIRIIDDAYNASVESMESAMVTLVDMKRQGERSVAILGSMFEMGDYTKEGHEIVGQKVADIKPDCLVVIGLEGKYIYKAALDAGYDKVSHYYETKEEFIAYMMDILSTDDLVLLKASRGMAFEVIREEIIERYRK